MNYEELIAKALKQRSVNSMAKAWGVQQVTLNRYVTGKNMPDYDTAMKIAKEAGVDPGEAFEILAAEERNRKSRNFKLAMGFATPGILAVIAAITMAVTLFLTTPNANAADMRAAPGSSYAQYKLCEITRMVQRAILAVLTRLKRMLVPTTLTPTAS